MPDHVPFLRIFVSSPGDVNDERKIALEVIDQLPYRPAFREKVAFRVIAWDKPGAGTAMRATLTPQDAINKGLPTPAQCDIVVVIFWSRMGTPFTDKNGKAYQSGTEWELLNALESDRAETLIYRRTDDPPFKITDPDFDNKLAQYRLVEAFFKSELFYQGGEIQRAVNAYKTPDDFRRAFEIHLEELVTETLSRLGAAPSSEAPIADHDNVTTLRAAPWPPDRSPFPGLNAFTESDADIFFGRGYETDALIRQLTASRFVAVVGASGSGKSSLVGAGLIPRLRANAIPGSKDWRIVRFTPNTAPFDNLYTALLELFPQLKPNPLEARRIRQNFIADLREAPDTLLDICTAGMDGLPVWTETLLFIDQFEELFTLASKTDAQAFASLLDAVAHAERMRAVVTMRADFYHRAVEYPELAALLRAGSFPLAIPKRDALRQMIERPAERAGITFDHALIDRILDDTGDEPGNLALMAFALDELYKLDDDKLLTHTEYEHLGGVQGAIGTRAENTFAKTGADERLIQQIFHSLIEVDERGTATRRRADFKPETLADDVRDLVSAFTNARLLTTSYDDRAERATVEVAHEAILRSWPRLAAWIEDTQDDLRLLRQVRNTAQEWEEKGRPDYLRWPAERLTLVYAMLERLKPELNEVEQDFIEPEQKRLLRELETLPKDETSHERRRDIGDRLAVIGDTRPGIGVKDGIPAMEWLPVPGSDEPYEFEFGTFRVKPFMVAKYLITYGQFQAFVDAEDGFNDLRWWDEMPDEYKRQELDSQRTKVKNAPRDSVSWYQAVAFARWMNHRLHGQQLEHPSAGVLEVGDNAEIRLPTEWEWQWMAQGGAQARAYPWGKWQVGYANTSEAGLSRTTAIGMYPHGAAVCGALDVAGNLFEWCQNDKDDPTIITGFGNEKYKVLRGGSFSLDQDLAAASYRYSNSPSIRFNVYGVRLVLSAPI
jgi:formylglycine-generating enzyme required for sulfatase activity